MAVLVAALLWPCTWVGMILWARGGVSTGLHRGFLRVRECVWMWVGAFALALAAAVGGLDCASRARVNPTPRSSSQQAETFVMSAFYNGVLRTMKANYTIKCVG